MAMTQSIRDIFDAALALSEEEQLQLIAALVSTVDQRSPAPLDESWREEIRRRSAEYDAGGITPISWAEVKAEARREIMGHE